MGKPAKCKRNISDVSNTSIEDMSTIMSDLDEIKSKLVTKGDIQTIVTSIVKEMLLEAKNVMQKEMEEFKSQQEEVKSQLNERIDKLEKQNIDLREELARKSKSMREMEINVNQTSKIAKKAESKANFNEQYSRKTNIKIYGVTEKERENTKLIVCQMLKEVAEVQLEENEIIATHRIPAGKPGLPRPIILKVKNSEIKSRIMKQRSKVKSYGHGLRLADDVTELNIQLLKRLSAHHQIEQAYYFNGYVYGRVKGGSKRLRFDIHTDIDKKIKKGHRQPSLASGYNTNSDSDDE
ncbi:hypothetical protein FSP39_007070 [Pinctada imbricata]|uniref:Uncharacterized protein n=1 Tax=Pinctada imbricata TaxID=66713 RepID=A0AA89BWP3_PINIB|nr:hypothetical protein FSP39_007070 [Pinctada imbricata]